MSIMTKIRYGYWWHARARLRYYRLHVTRRILWRMIGSKALYKPYVRGTGSGFAGRFVWRDRIVCYVSEHGTKWL